MHDLAEAIPDPDVVLALEPEELGAKLLFLARRRFGNGGSFHPQNLESELLNQTGRPGPGYVSPRGEELTLAYTEAWMWIEAQALIVPEPGMNGRNGWRRFSRKARNFENEAAFEGFLHAKKLPKEYLHRLISEPVWLAFVRGEYDVAVFLAMKAVEVAVREAIGAPADQIGTRLVRTAFHPETGPLTDPAADGGERQARADLFAGAIGSYKNPQSHRRVELRDPVEAVEQILLASHLLRIVESRAAALPPGDELAHG